MGGPGAGGPSAGEPGAGGSWGALLAAASKQHGVFLAAQAGELGVSNQALRSAVAAGRVRRVRRGVYAVGGRPPSTWERVTAVGLAGGAAAPGTDGGFGGGGGRGGERGGESGAGGSPGGRGGRGGGRSGGPVVAALSHWTAAAIHRFPKLAPVAGHDLTVAGNRRVRLEGVRIHRVGDLPWPEVVVRSGLVVTRPVRTLVDLAPQMEEPLLERILDEGNVMKLWSFEEVIACLAGRSGSGYAGCRSLRAALAPRLGSPAVDSALEQRVVRVLAPLRPFVTGYQVVLDGQVALLDLAWPHHKVGLEVDGWAAHTRSRLAFDRDRRRGNLLAAHGWLVAHVTSRMDDATILRDVRRLLAIRGVPG